MKICATLCVMCNDCVSPKSAARKATQDVITEFSQSEFIDFREDLKGGSSIYGEYSKLFTMPNFYI